MTTSENLENGSSIISTYAGVKKKFWRCAKAALLCVFIIGVWSAVSLPIVAFYQLPISVISSTNGNNASASDSVCSAPLQYALTNGICLAEFDNILISSNCPPDHEGNVFIVKNAEATTSLLINKLKSAGASAECISKAVPFFCLYQFGLCGLSGVSIQPTSSQCEEIRDAQCQQQWMLLQRLGIDLPDCALFPAEASFCPALNDSHTSSGTVMTNISVLECTEGFYKENGSSICIPSCYTWSPGSKVVTKFGDVVVFICIFIGFLAATAIIIISCLARKRILVYPTIFVVYMMIDSMFLDVIVMVGYMDRKRLYCSSRSLIESMMEVTPFCVFAGIVFTYVLCQTSLWWLFHIATLFWQVIFPFHALSYETSNKNKYIHITCIIFGILLPQIPIITSMADFGANLPKQNENSSSQLRNNLFLSGGLGFGPSGYPTIVCIGRDPEIVLYSFIMMTGIILSIGCSLLLIIFWSVHKSHVKRKRIQQEVINENPKYRFTFGKAEKKLFIVFIYYIGLAAVVPIPYSLPNINFTKYLDSFQKNFVCVQASDNLGNPCSDSDIERNIFTLMGILSYILMALFPVVNLLYIVNIQELKKFWTKAHRSMPH